MLDATEFLAMVHAADDAGLSQSAFIRSLIKREVASHAMRIVQLQALGSAGSAQD
jgi:hypothetical protein